MNKNKEKFYLRKFLEIIYLEPLEIRGGERENPDFVLPINNRKVGIEVTEYHSNLKGVDGRPRRAHEENWFRLQKIIMQEVRENKALKKIHGILFFKKGLNTPNKKLYEEFSKELIDLAVVMKNSGITETTPRFNQKLLLKYLEKLQLKKFNSTRPLEWNWDKDVEHIGVSEQELIDSVHGKTLTNYKDKDIMDELWLVIISGWRVSQDIPDISLYEKLKEYTRLDATLKKSNFDNVFLYLHSWSAIYEWPAWNKIKRSVELEKLS